MKPPAHSVKKVDGKILVLRLKEPKFHAIYNPDTNTLQDLHFEAGAPANEQSLINKAIASAKQAIRTGAV